MSIVTSPMLLVKSDSGSWWHDPAGSTCGHRHRESQDRVDATRRRTQKHLATTAEVDSVVVSELCHIRPQTPGQHGDLRGHVNAYRCCVKSSIASAVDGISCASAGASGVAFQACSFNHSDISPL